MRHTTSIRSALAALMLGAGAAALAPVIAEARPIRGGAATSISRPAVRPGAGGAGVRNTAITNRGGNAVANRSGNRINTGNVRIGNNTNINVNNNDHGWDWDDHYHPVAAGVAFGTAAAVTSAAIGSMMYSLPPSCAPYPYGGYSYYSCGGVYYEPRYEGDKVVYVVVNNPH
jgi:hypothetical protein